MSDWTVEQEAIKAAFSIGVGAITLGFGWLVGQRLTSMWSLRQKRRELDLAATSELHRIYGEFFAVWKLWNYCHERLGKDASSDIRWQLMQRAALVEAGFEALLIKVTSERILEASTLADLGILRQSFQRLRASIKKEQSLDWSYSEHPEYLSFKRLTCSFSNLLASDHSWAPPGPSAAAASLIEVTANKYETRIASAS